MGVRPSTVSQKIRLSILYLALTVRRGYGGGGGTKYLYPVWVVFTNYPQNVIWFTGIYKLVHW